MSRPALLRLKRANAGSFIVVADAGARMDTPCLKVEKQQIRAGAGQPNQRYSEVLQWQGFKILRMIRRAILARTGSALVALTLPRTTAATSAAEKIFIAEAARMMREAVTTGDAHDG